MPVARTPRGAQNEITKLFHDAAITLGYPGDPDMNDPTSAGGIGAVPLNVVDGRRVNTAAAYLLPVLCRSNLDVFTESTVVAVLFDGTRATGVEVVRNGRVSRVIAPSVVLCAGAVRTPQLLMLSGVGPADHIAELGVPVVLDHPFVGREFSDHPEVGVHYRTPLPFEPASPLQEVLHVDDLEIRPYTAAFDRLIPGLPIGDPMIGVGLMRSDSRGDITLVSSMKSPRCESSWRHHAGVSGPHGCPNREISILGIGGRSSRSPGGARSCCRIARNAVEAPSDRGARSPGRPSAESTGDFASPFGELRDGQRQRRSRR